MDQIIVSERFYILQMRYVAAYLLAVIGGKASPTQNDIEKILSSDKKAAKEDSESDDDDMGFGLFD
ncbi:Similar to RpLP2: 60S acidic ribosomal protein P2 (Drosophila melanogaster) [Cotesia congregata]|uniref:Large ribosomal subunit protein P2 n=1 Tax=Cotesia congregata TaxID=51543 RepID=A0A8J2H624_COTCN|nr:Similar to RpLP2: 60S acidic ribosomal protein P2 (Drosophila melanogaster) [Cotesia congregata]